MKNTLKINIPAKSISYMIIFGGLIVLIVLLIILPFNRYNDNRKKDVQKMEKAIEEQNGLRQVYLLLASAMRKKDSHTLPNPEKTKLALRDVDSFQNLFREKAQKAGLRIVSLTPDIKTASSGSKNLLYSADLKGEYVDFRTLLVEVGAMPYVKHIEEINMQQQNDAIEMKMKIWIALAN